MKISLRILLGYFLLVAIAAWFVLNIFVEEIKPGVRQTTEDALIDTAQVLAQIATQDIHAGRIDNGALAQAFEQLQQNPIRNGEWYIGQRAAVAAIGRCKGNIIAVA